jgi:hypothetical protein
MCGPNDMWLANFLQILARQNNNKKIWPIQSILHQKKQNKTKQKKSSDFWDFILFYFSKSSDFIDKFEWVAKHIEGLCFFSTLLISSILPNLAKLHYGWSPL